MTGAEGADVLNGGCGCGQLQYQMAGLPIVVHCCHCSDCQRSTGSAYALNAIIETDRFSVTGRTDTHIQPTPSGKGQVMTRCADCGTGVFTRYMVREGKLTYVRVGTLDNPALCPPDVQIFTADKQPWVPLNADIPAFEGLYDFSKVLPDAALTRWRELFG